MTSILVMSRHIKSKPSRCRSRYRHVNIACDTKILHLQYHGAANTAVTCSDELPQCTIVWKVGLVVDCFALFRIF